MVHVTAGIVPLASNFLVPNGTFFVELIAFGIIVWILAKFVIPPINRAMTARQEAIKKETQEKPERQQPVRGDRIQVDPAKQRASNLADKQARLEFDTREARKSVEEASKEVAAKLTPGALVELQLSVGFYIMTSKFLETFAVDMQPAANVV